MIGLFWFYSGVASVSKPYTSFKISNLSAPREVCELTRTSENLIKDNQKYCASLQMDSRAWFVIRLNLFIYFFFFAVFPGLDFADYHVSFIFLFPLSRRHMVFYCARVNLKSASINCETQWYDRNVDERCLLSVEFFEKKNWSNLEINFLTSDTLAIIS